MQLLVQIVHREMGLVGVMECASGLMDNVKKKVCKLNLLRPIIVSISHILFSFFNPSVIKMHYCNFVTEGVKKTTTHNFVTKGSMCQKIRNGPYFTIQIFT